jgi:hypothetical protein
MFARALLVGGGLLMASLSPAFAASVTATVQGWDPASRTLTLEDMSQFTGIPAAVAVPSDLSVGDTVTIDFEGSDTGGAGVNSIVIAKKRQAPPPRG